MFKINSNLHIPIRCDSGSKLFIFLLTLMITYLGIIGCSNNMSKLEVESQDLTSSSEQSTVTQIEMIPIESDNVLEAGYNSITRILTIRFKSGGLYEYYDVDKEVWNSFLAAQPNPWSLVGYPVLVEGNFSYRRIE